MRAMERLLLFLLCSSSLVVCKEPLTKRTSPNSVSVGAVLSDEQHAAILKEAAEKVSSDGSLPPGVSMNVTAITVEINPLVMAMELCSQVITKQVFVVLASHKAGMDYSPTAISYTCGFYKIPVIGLSARDSVFSDKNVHNSFMRTVAPYWDQAEVWVDIVEHFNFKSVLFVHSGDQEGRAMLGKFQNKAEERDIKIDHNIQYMAGVENYTDILHWMTEEESRVILLYASEEDAANIYRDAGNLNLTGSGYAWIVTEQALRPHNTPEGVLSLKLQNADNEEGHIKDAVRIVAKAYKAMHEANEPIPRSPHDCSQTLTGGENGDVSFRYLTQQELLNGATGKVKFNEVGDRVNPVYKIVNKQGDREVEVGSYNPNSKPKLSLEDVGIVWPGGETKKPKGVKISTHLKVVTISELPFIYTKTMEEAGYCDRDNRVPCSHIDDATGVRTEYCCTGYCIDLLIELAKKVNFTFDLHVVHDGNFGSYELINGTRQWTGMIGEIKTGRADLIVAPMTIDPDRAEHIDFTKPFKYQGLTILVKKTTKDSSLASFLQPFQDTLWILVGLSVHVVALVLYLLDRFSPFGRFKLAKSDDTEEDALNLSNAVWFAWGVLLNSGIGEGTPRSFSARVLGMVWAGFAMIIVASYTANLAAFLVLDRPEASITGIDDARLRNPQENFRYATVKNSAVAAYFKRQVELSTMYRTMESRNLPDAKTAIDQVKSGQLQAFIWDSSRLEFEAAKECDLVTAGELFGRSGYGIGLPKNSPWTQEISLTILSFHESGFMENLDGKWILVEDTKCPEKDTSPATLGLTNMAGVFMMVAGGIVAGVFLIFIEIAYKRHRGLKEKELELAKTAADRWRGNIEKRKTLRRSLLAQQHELAKTNSIDTTLPGPGGGGAAFSASFPGASPPAKKYDPPGFDEALKHPTVRTPGMRPGGYQPVATSIVKRNPLYIPEEAGDTLA